MPVALAFAICERPHRGSGGTLAFNVERDRLTNQALDLIPACARDRGRAGPDVGAPAVAVVLDPVFARRGCECDLTKDVRQRAS